MLKLHVFREETLQKKLCTSQLGKLQEQPGEQPRTLQELPATSQEHSATSSMCQKEK